MRRFTMTIFTATQCCNIVATLVIYATGRQEEEDGRTLVCDKRDKAISYVFCRDVHLTSMYSGLLQKDLFKGR